MNSNMKFVSEKPKHRIVREVISHYYFHSSDSYESKFEFAYYPHFKHAITSYLNAEISFYEGGNDVRESKLNQVQTIFTRLHDGYRYVKLIGRFQKLGVVLNPLAINRILCSPNKITSHVVRDFYVGEFDQWNYLVTEIWNVPAEQRVDLLDDFFLRHIYDVTDSPLLEEVERLIENPEDFSASSMSVNLNISERSLRRVFKDEVGFGFARLKKIARFRKALDSFNKNPNQRLTELALVAQFYDQPDFIKNIRSISGLKPSAFFDSIHDLGAGTYWREL